MLCSNTPELCVCIVMNISPLCTGADAGFKVSTSSKSLLSSVAYDCAIDFDKLGVDSLQRYQQVYGLVSSQPRCQLLVVLFPCNKSAAVVRPIPAQSACQLQRGSPFQLLTCIFAPVMDCRCCCPTVVERSWFGLSGITLNTKK